MDKFRQGLIRFMAGRRGQDEFCLALFGVGLFFWLLSLFTGWWLFQLVYMLCWIYGIFRGLSRNIAARERENRWFLSKFGPLMKSLRQAWTRYKNRKVYLYYRCPQCKSRLKIPRNIGEKTVTCSHCGATFNKKA